MRNFAQKRKTNAPTRAIQKCANRLCDDGDLSIFCRYTRAAPLSTNTGTITQMEGYLYLVFQPTEQVLLYYSQGIAQSGGAPRNKRRMEVQAHFFF